MVAVVQAISMNFGRTGGLADLGTVDVGTSVTLTFSNLAASTAYKVDWGYGSPDTSVTSNGSGVATATHTYLSAGRFTATLRNAADTVTVSMTDVVTRGLVSFTAPVNATVAETFTFALAPSTTYEVDWGDSTAASSITTSAGTDERQTLTVNGNPTGGSFIATVAGIPLTIPYNATVPGIQALIDAQPTLAGNLTINGTTGAFEFGGDLATTDVATITINAAGLTGGTSPSVSVVTNTAGSVVGTVTAPHTYATTGSKTISVSDQYEQVVATKTLTVAA